MTLTPKEAQTARRNLAQRVGKLVDKIEKEAREPTELRARLASLYGEG